MKSNKKINLTTYHSHRLQMQSHLPGDLQYHHQSQLPLAGRQLECHHRESHLRHPSENKMNCPCFCTVSHQGLHPESSPSFHQIPYHLYTVYNHHRQYLHIEDWEKISPTIIASSFHQPSPVWTPEGNGQCCLYARYRTSVSKMQVPTTAYISCLDTTIYSHFQPLMNYNSISLQQLTSYCIIYSLFHSNVLKISH